MKNFISQTAKNIKRLINVTFKAFMVSVPLSFSLFIYTNATESILQKDIVSYTNAITTYSYEPSDISNYQIIENPNLTGNLVGDYGKPISILLPSANRKLELVPAILDSNKLLTKPNSAHFLVNVTTEKVANVYIYALSSWRTIPNPELITAGENLYIDTNREWRYVFNIEEVLLVNPENYTIPVSDRTQIIFTIKTKKSEYILIRSTYRTVLPIGR